MNKLDIKLMRAYAALERAEKRKVNCPGGFQNETAYRQLYSIWIKTLAALMRLKQQYYLNTDSEWEAPQ